MNQHRPSNLDLMRYADGELEPEAAEQVERYLHGSEQARAVVATFEEIGHGVRQAAEGLATEGEADGIAGLVMQRIEAERSGAVVPLAARPKRTRRIAIAASATAALAAAAAFVVVAWRLLGIEPTSVATRLAPSFEPPEISRPERLVASAAPAPDRLSEPGVSVEAVDFGATTGTIFYVPGQSGATTTVVWLTDEPEGKP